MKIKIFHLFENKIVTSGQKRIWELLPNEEDG